jgi:hypothetical protein
MHTMIAAGTVAYIPLFLIFRVQVISTNCPWIFDAGTLRIVVKIVTINRLHHEQQRAFKAGLACSSSQSGLTLERRLGLLATTAGDREHRENYRRSID